MSSESSVNCTINATSMLHPSSDGEAPILKWHWPGFALRLAVTCYLTLASLDFSEDESSFLQPGIRLSILSEC